MNITSALFMQTCTMFALMAVGAVLFRLGLISQGTSRDLGAVLLNVVFPVVIVRSFWGKYADERLVALGLTFVLALAALALGMAIAHLCFRDDGVADFAAAFSNAGFIGIPLVESALGADAVFYIACFIAQLNILQWTYGKWRISGSTASISPKAVFTSPMLIGFVIGLGLFLLRVPVPAFASNLMQSLANLNSPVAMIILGTYLAQSDPRELFTTPVLYAVSAVRLLAVPAATLALLALVPADATIKYALLIAASAPVGSNVAVFCQQLEHPTQGATGMVCLSTLLSLATMPLVASAAALVF